MHAPDFQPRPGDELVEPLFAALREPRDLGPGEAEVLDAHGGSTTGTHPAVPVEGPVEGPQVLISARLYMAVSGCAFGIGALVWIF